MTFGQNLKVKVFPRKYDVGLQYYWQFPKWYEPCHGDINSPSYGALYMDIQIYLMKFAILFEK